MDHKPVFSQLTATVQRRKKIFTETPGARFSTMFARDGTGTGSRGPRNGTVVKKHFGEEMMRFAFEGAWIKSSRFSDLDAGTSELMKQKLVLAVERMYRV